MLSRAQGNCQYHEGSVRILSLSSANADRTQVRKAGRRCTGTSATARLLLRTAKWRSLHLACTQMMAQLIVTHYYFCLLLSQAFPQIRHHLLLNTALWSPVFKTEKRCVISNAKYEKIAPTSLLIQKVGSSSLYQANLVSEISNHYRKYICTKA